MLTHARVIRVGGLILLGLGLVATGAQAAPIQISSLVGVPNPALVGQNVTFTEEIRLSSADANTTITINSVTNYMFDFGDGLNTGLLNDLVPKGPANPVFADEVAQHAYVVAGVYNVTFTGTVNFTTVGGDPSAFVQTSRTEVIAAVPEPGTGTLIVVAVLAGISLMRLRTIRARLGAGTQTTG